MIACMHFLPGTVHRDLLYLRSGGARTPYTNKLSQMWGTSEVAGEWGGEYEQEINHANVFPANPSLTAAHLGGHGVVLVAQNHDTGTQHMAPFSA